MSRRLFSRDPLTGITKYWHYDADTDTAVIEYEHDVEQLLDANEAQANSYTSSDRIGEWQRIASIPMSMYAELLVSGKIHDEAYMRRWLNDRDNRRFRTRHIQV